MRLATAAESQRIDERAQNEFGLSGEILMEAAGSLAAREILQTFVAETRLGGITVVCGPGNNGGDGLVVARHLHSAGVRDVRVRLVGDPNRSRELFRRQLDLSRRTGLPIGEGIGDLPVQRLIVDALFGIGLKRDVAGEFQYTIESLNRLKVPIVSLDVPSGLDVDRGVARGVAIRASQTLTFGLAKPGFFISEGPAHVGRLRVLPIGVPRKLIADEAKSTFAFTDKMALRYLPKSSAVANKSTHGHALLIAGHPGMWGAALLAGSSASRIGAGYVTLTSLSRAPQEVLKSYPELLVSDVRDETLWVNPRWKACGIGPGLGVTESDFDEMERILKRLIDLRIKKVVLDADAITFIAQRKFWPIPDSWVLTPHAGELSRILDTEAKMIEADRIGSARAAAEKMGCHVLLKGFRTVLASGGGASKGRAWICLSGNSALAKAGTGDVLTGMITGLMAQGLDPLPAAGVAAYCHGRLADEWVRSGQDRRSLQASDLRDFLPTILARLREVRP